ncbi:MAG: hypothetical protein ACLFP1_07710 [Candidatus Goldiibacteriota bacterium]
MKKIIIVSAFLSAFMFASCAGVLTVKAPGISGGKIVKEKKKKRVKPVLFEDFEAGVAVGAYMYENEEGNASAEKLTATDEDKYAGNYSAKSEFDTGIHPDWGCGMGTQSAYGGGFIEIKGTDTFTAWVKAPPGMTFYFFCNEFNGEGGDGEFWNSPDQMGTGAWKYYEIPFDMFFKNAYSGNQDGNSSIDPVIGTVGFQFAGAQGKGTVYIDEIYFK